MLISITSCAQTSLPDTTSKRTIDKYSSVYKDSLVGKPLIGFEASLLNGETVRLEDQKGKVILLNFWFIGCAPYMGEIGDINKIHTGYKDSNVVVLSLARNSTEQLNKFNKGKFSKPTEPILYPIVPSCEEIAGKYGVTGYPTTILIDKKGVIRLVYAGASIASLKKYVDFYGSKNLSKEWKKILDLHKNDTSPDMYTILSALISDLLREE